MFNLRSAYRQNLDRHCKKRDHFSELLIRTSKKPDPRMLELASQMSFGVTGGVQQEESVEEEEEELDEEPEEVQVNFEESMEVDAAEGEESSADSDDNPNKFCNFDIKGLLEGEDQEQESQEEEESTA